MAPGMIAAGWEDVGASTVGLLGLTALRWWAVLRVQSHWRRAIGPSWQLVCVVVAVVLALGILGSLPVDWPPSHGPEPGVEGAHTQPTHWLGLDDRLLVSWLWRGLWEFGLGTLLGYLFALPGQALLGAAAAGASRLGTDVRTWTALHGAWVVSAAMIFGLHHALLQGAADLSAGLPVGQPQAWWAGASQLEPELLARVLAGTLIVSLTLATPVLLSAAVVEFGAAALSQGAAGASELGRGVAPGLRLAVALIALGSSWALHTEGWARAMVPALTR